MATWAVGDIQGCWRTFATLLDAIDFNPRKDRIWLAGDLVNRGPGSLDVLRWCVEHDKVVKAVLGNHDLHLLAQAEGLRQAGKRDTLDAVLGAPDRDDLLRWLRGRPLLYRGKGHVLVHAGLLPHWTVDDAKREADRIATKVRKNPRSALLVPPVGDDVLPWNPKKPSRKAALTALTTLRCVDRKGRIVRNYNGPPDEAPTGAIPWYRARKRRWKGQGTVLFGHWAAMGHRRGKGWVSLDSGCVWGGVLTAYRLRDGTAVQVPNQERGG
ncbi:MAG: symmetrical bis(5'-nucleosyl)-tetraphosphatase [Deltaproteobacteria bacterium]|nr:symmetrical bis(5'-nucleosyl)-tetraphosphatase [Deltaproteobacteria bacterium]